MSEQKKNLSPMTSVLIVAAISAAAWFGIPPIRKAMAINAMPAPIERNVDPQNDVRPIFEARCSRCHGEDRAKSGFNYETREALLKGGNGGVVVVPGDSRNSPLIHQIAGVPYTEPMPRRGGPLTDDEVAVLRAWIDQGMAWPESAGD